MRLASPAATVLGGGAPVPLVEAVAALEDAFGACSAGEVQLIHAPRKLGAYLSSLERLHALAESHEIERVWPGHGPVIDDALAVLTYYLEHRQQRLDQVRDALVVLGGEASPREVVEHVYTDVDPVLWGAAELSVRAQLEYLRA